MGPAQRAQVWLSHKMCITCNWSDALLKGRRKIPNPQNPGPKHDLWLLELMGDSRLLLPQEIAQIFFGNYQCPVLPSGILSAAPQQPGWRNAQGLQLDVCCRADPWGGCRAWCWLSPPWAVVLGHGYSVCCQHPFVDACGEWRWWWFVMEENV